MAGIGATEDLILYGDLGGTNLRLALSAGGVRTAVSTFQVADHATLEVAIGAYLSQMGSGPVHEVRLAVAGPVQDGIVHMTNHSWSVSDAALKAAFALREARVLNDFVANAWALPDLGRNDVEPIGSGTAVANAPMVILGPGTGLGLAYAIHCHEGIHVLASEGGHATIAAGNDREDAVIGFLRKSHDHVSAERLLSGPGLQNIVRALAAIDGLGRPLLEAPHIVQAARDGADRLCEEAVAMFCALLGDFAGNAALAISATGGVFLAGGILPKMIDLLAASRFRTRFDAKGRMKFLAHSIPVSVVLRPDLAIAGLEAERKAGLVR